MACHWYGYNAEAWRNCRQKQLRLSFMHEASGDTYGNQYQRCAKYLEIVVIILAHELGGTIHLRVTCDDGHFRNAAMRYGLGTSNQLLIT